MGFGMGIERRHEPFVVEEAEIAAKRKQVIASKNTTGAYLVNGVLDIFAKGLIVGKVVESGDQMALHRGACEVVDDPASIRRYG
ncbi:MAG: hypothetical protein O3C49_05765 [Proteobacteria bacterium]|nr:hypothetical protein [Pseudomonadota bacterium]MDA1326446.1 hypothetical protein [Pseudomonadota bacterium]